MNLNDLLMNNMLLGSIPKINSGYIIIDSIYFLLLLFIFNYMSHINFSNLFKDISFDRSNKITYVSCKKKNIKKISRNYVFCIKKR